MPYRDFYKIKTNGEAPQKGMLLLSEPFLRDTYFLRSVILLINHNEEGSMGLILDKPLPMRVNEIIPEFKYLEPIPLYNGGPVGLDNLFYIHNIKNIKDSLHLGKDLFLNGDFEELKKYILQGNPVDDHIRFFRGYSGWDPYQLESELKTNSWIIVPRKEQALHYNKEMWRETMKSLGGKYAIWANFPLIPSFN